MSPRNARLVQLLGLLVALTGLVGFWLNRDVEQLSMGTFESEIIGIPPDNTDNTLVMRFILAGRDYDYSVPASPCQWRNGVCYRERTGVFHLGNRTDTMLYVQIVNDKLTVIALPRDIYLPHWQVTLNEMYHYQGAAGLKREAEKILGLLIDYYAIINIDLFEELVDALGGVEVNIPYRMYRRDAAADLLIDFQPGPAHLSGEDAAKFIRFRDAPRGDLDRLDNTKALANSMFQRVKDLNIRAAIKLPEILNAVFGNVETNVPLSELQKLLPKINSLQLQTATIPTYFIEGSPTLGYDPKQVSGFVAATLSGKERDFAEVPEATLLISNRSGIEGLELAYKDRLVALGISEANVMTRQQSLDPAPSRILAIRNYWEDADFFVSLLNATRQQVDNLGSHDGERVHLELILGQDAAQTVLGQSRRITSQAQVNSSD